MKKCLEKIKQQVIQMCREHNYCPGCSIWNPWEKKCNLFDNESMNITTPIKLKKKMTQTAKIEP